MEAAFVLIPIALTIMSSVGFTCYYTRLNNRIVSLENSFNNLVSSINSTRQTYSAPPPPSAPPAYLPGYGYQHYPGDPIV